MITAALAALMMPAQANDVADKDALTKEARQQIKQLAMQLKQTLKKSMKSDGPQAAIKVCNTQAPVIADKLSQGDWQVGRTALKWRNADNKPNAWETSVMEGFSAQIQAGADVKTLDASKIENGRFYYMKAIPTGAVCLACHGEKLADPIAAKLDQLYPQDNARGFKTGELRGAFTLIKQLDTHSKGNL